MDKLFGTDGIRGRANQYPMTAMMALKTGSAVAAFVKRLGLSSIVIGKDTRMSGDMFETALCAGIASRGVDALVAGVIPTPGVAFLAADIENCGAGIVISASHNPYYDNGIKIFKGDGSKLVDEEENRIEEDIVDGSPKPVDDIGTIRHLPHGTDRYAAFLKSCFDLPETPSPLKIVVDCSNGAAFKVAPLVFDSPLFIPEFICCAPDGRNINDNCGSQHTEKLSQRILDSKADLGLAFDGDADRLIAVDETGTRITGDQILAICAKQAKKEGRLDNSSVVTTVMSNIGFLKAVDSLGIHCLVTDVGDRKVLEKMVETGAVMGGEDSGHMIFSRYHTTGDGILTALRLVSVMAASGKPLSELARVMTIYPQVLMNVEVDASRPDFMQIKPIADEINRVKEELDGNGRVLVRYSGTQPLLRVMVEGPSQEKTRAYCMGICDKIRAFGR
ncbi:MAG TPA: phosphoglucosamine mutase [Desulfobacteraceae bacterium]|nr:phosphoglucosamine mutase [Desulfobacteraceae bacterium]